MADDQLHVIIEVEVLMAGFMQMRNQVMGCCVLLRGHKLTYMIMLSYPCQKDTAYECQYPLAEHMGSPES